MSTSTNRNKKTAFAGATSRAPGKSRRTGGPAPSIGSQNRAGRSVYGGASRTVLSSSSRKNVQVAGSDRTGPSSGPNVQVFDDEGHDVTPLPLLQLDPNAVRKNQSNILADSSGGTPTDLMSQASIYQTGTVTASTFGGPFTRDKDKEEKERPLSASFRSVFSASQSGRSTGSIDESLEEPAEGMQGWTDAKVTYKREEVQEELTEEDLEKAVEINLTETDTIWLLDMAGVCVSLENEEAVQVREQNAKYQELVKSRVGNDLYVERAMNTFNDAPKTKNVQTMRIGYTDIGINANTWDMYDTFKLVEELEAKAKEEEEEGTASRPVSTAPAEDGEKCEKGDDGKVSPAKDAKGLESQATILSSMAGTDSVFASKESGVTAVQEEEKINEAHILESENFRRDLQIMERAVNLNCYQPRQAAYRGLEEVPDIDKLPSEQTEETPKKTAITVHPDLGPNLDRLWEYKCPLTKGRNVSCIAWNRENPDLLAVAYGQFEFSKQKGGLVCCWSLKNPEYPERVYSTSVGVTAMDFSVAHANLLAVGLYDGTVAIFNVRTTSNEPVLDSLRDMRSGGDDNESSGKHTSPVWQLKWIEKERGSGEEKAEVLVSISTDGRVTQWSIRKGFESYDLMKLKRVAPKTIGGKAKKSEALISKFAGGLCFDFNAKDSNIYLAGTEEGHIHRCSCSYNEQYLDSYFGHTGPVYGIQWCPFSTEVFLSCSGDWSVRLWHQDRLKPVLNFFSSTKSIPSVCWSPRCSTVFACVNEGAVEVWDLAQSTLDPIINNTPPPGVKLSSVSFAKNSDCVLVGDSEGQVAVFQLRGMPAVTGDQSEILHKIINSSLASELEPKK